MPMKNPTLDAFFPRGIRNFNPGNIENGPFARSQPGYVGSDGRFAQFDTMDHGIDAQSALLHSYGNKGLNTLNAIINRYAPSSDGNNTNRYASFVAKKMGVDPNQPLDMNDPTVRRNMAMAMGRFENGMSPVDPRTWQASATPQPATGNPMQLPGATIAPTAAPPEQPQGAQAISLGSDEQQPFNNIGSTLANMGASIASLDNRGTGIASLNASRVASNLTAQEAARERENGWKYAGQTQNGQGMIFQNAQGEIRVEPLSGQFAGNKSDETSLQKDFAWAGNDPEKMKLVNASHGVKQDDALDPEDSKFWADYVINDPKALAQVPKNLRPQVMHDLRGLAEKSGLGGKDLYQTVLSNAGNLADEKRRSQLEANIDSFKGDFLAGAKQVADYSKALPRGFDQKPLESAYQWAEENAGTPEAEKINSLKVSLEGMERGYVRALSASNVGGVEAEKKARQLFDPAQKHSVLMAGVKAATQDVLKYNQLVKDAHDNKRAKNAGKPLPHPELEDEDAAIKKLFGIGESSKTQSTGLPSVGKKTTINGVEIERLE